MNVEKDDVLVSRAGTATTTNPPEASKPSLDSSGSSGRVRGSKRRGKLAVTPSCSEHWRAGTGSCSRVLRARAVATDAENAHDEKRPARVRRTRGKRAGSCSRNTPAMQNAIKKSTTKQASKTTLGQQRSRSGGVKGKLKSPALHSTQAKACKPEETEASSCGEEPAAVKGSDKEKSRRCTASQQKEVKKEDSEKKEEGGIKEEESTEELGQNEDKVGENTEQPSRKRGRRQKDSTAPRQPKKRKKPPVQYVRCEIEGCGTVLAHPRYLQHHIKYQHLLKKKYVCDHPSCGRLFRLQKQLLRHAKHHTDQRDYICEYCARAFKSSHNLAVHRMIHTGEKPIQCEICGFTCRQKASLNWHMKKHDAEASYQFSCSICGKKFEKKDSVIAHKAKSHPEIEKETFLSDHTPDGRRIVSLSPDSEEPSTEEQVQMLHSALRQCLGLLHCVIQKEKEEWGELEDNYETMKKNVRLRLEHLLHSTKDLVETEGTTLEVTPDDQCNEETDGGGGGFKLKMWTYQVLLELVHWADHAAQTLHALHIEREGTEDI